MLQLANFVLPVRIYSELAASVAVIGMNLQRVRYMQQRRLQ